MRTHNRIADKKIQLPVKIKQPVLALGPQAKNTLCFAYGNMACVSKAHADLGIVDDCMQFEKDAKFFLKRKPKIIAHDLHPEYQSTKFIRQLGAKRYALSAIQHHHAHIASCMAENGLKNKKVIGVAFDGTGMGEDGVLRGAEFMLCDYRYFHRKAQLEEIPLLGGERAILEPWRPAAAWLGGIQAIKGIDGRKWRALNDMQKKGINSLPASSMGRLFDAAACLILKKNRAEFEAELAIELERLASDYQLAVSGYSFKIIKKNGLLTIDPRPVLRQIVNDIKSHMPKEKIAYRFHRTIAEMVKKVCIMLHRDTGVNTVVLSGGVFQNNLLLCMALDLLYKERFAVITHKILSCNDSGVSLGQAVIAGVRG
jgi:hydrogenase maturation protein HypF